MSDGRVPTRTVERPARRGRAASIAVAVVVALLVMVLAVVVTDATFAADPAGAPRPPSSSPVAPTAGTTSTSTSTSTTQPTTTTAAPVSVESSPPDSAPPGAPAVTHAPGSWSWDDLADCESGEWVRHDDGSITFVDGSANWQVHNSVHEGGLQFAVSTWDDNKPAGYPDGAWQASREQQIAVGEIVLDKQGPGAWPRCSYLVGMR